MNKSYTITNMCSGDKFRMELTDEQLEAVMQLKDELGYVMKDISIETSVEGDMDDVEE